MVHCEVNMLNHIEIMGNLVAAPEMRTTSSGVKVSSFRIACERDYSSGNSQKETDFVDCVAWREKAEFVSKYFSKGMPILVSGRLQMRKWEDRDGNRRITAEIQAENLYFAGGEKRQTSVPAMQTEKPTPNDEYAKLGWDSADEGVLPF